jgi:GTP pyrophosphokinase
VPGLDRRYTLAAGLLELADLEFSLIHDQLQATVTDRQPEPDVNDPRISAQDLATFLAGQYADAGWSRTDHYGWVSGLLLELGITTLDELADCMPTEHADR